MYKIYYHKKVLINYLLIDILFEIVSQKKN